MLQTLSSVRDPNSTRAQPDKTMLLRTAATDCSGLTCANRIRQYPARKRHSLGIVAEKHRHRLRSASGRSIRTAVRCVVGICDHSPIGVRAPASLALLDGVNQRYRSFIGTRYIGVRYFSELHFFDLLQSNRLRSNLDSTNHCHLLQHSV
jgi:hypothetical protein